MTVRAADPARLSALPGEAPASLSMRRVLFITFDFPPSVEVGAYSCAQIARYLPLYGWEPIVLTATGQNYEFCDSRVEPTARVIRTSVIPHPVVVYRRLRSRFTRHAGGSSERDDPLAVDGLRKRFGESLATFLSVPDEYLGWLLPAVLAGLRASRRSGIRQLLSSGPHWTNHLVGLILAWVTRLPWTAHFRDPWIDAVDRNTTRKSVRWIEAVLERAVVTRAQSVVCVTSQHTELLQRRYSHLTTDKFVTIPNGYDEAEWDSVSDDGSEEGRTRTAGKFIITYAGSLYQDRTPEPLFRAVHHLIDDADVDITRCQIDLVGWWTIQQRQSLEAMAARHGLDQCLNVSGPLTKTETFRRLTGSNLLLLLAQGWTLQVPAKAYEYLRAGRPILALAPGEGAVASLFRKTGGAWVVDHMDEAGITAAVREAYLGWRNGRPWRAPDRDRVAEFDRARLTSRLAAIFHHEAEVKERQA